MPVTATYPAFRFVGLAHARLAVLYALHAFPVPRLSYLSQLAFAHSSHRDNLRAQLNIDASFTNMNQLHTFLGLSSAAARLSTRFDASGDG